jgi:hypothetical protein
MFCSARDKRNRGSPISIAWFLVWLYRLFPSLLDAVQVRCRKTILRWYRGGLRLYWCRRSPASGLPPWSPRGHSAPYPGDQPRQSAIGCAAYLSWLLKLGIEIGQTTAATYRARGHRPPSQGWRSFLRNHAGAIAAIDLFIVPTIAFRLLHVLVVRGHDQRKLSSVVVPLIPLRRGSPARSPRPFRGTMRRDT